jgi:hypothetical protein
VVLLRWLEQLAGLADLRWVVPAHYDAPVPLSADDLTTLLDRMRSRSWAPADGDWAYLARLDALLLRAGVVPDQPLD